MEPVNYLYAALNARIGYAVVSDNPQRLRTKLYAARRDAQRNGNYIFDEMSFFELPDGQTIFIVKHSALREWRGEQDDRQALGEV